MLAELSDFQECIAGADIPSQPKGVVKAWGEQGGGNEWEGGFVVELMNGQYAYIAGWCDYTGWG